MIWLVLCFVAAHLHTHAQSLDTANVSKLRAAKPFLRFGKRNGKLVLSLDKLFVAGEVFWLSFTIRNRSALSYPPEFFRLYVKDKEQTSRSSQQEIEIVPMFADSLVMVPARSKRSFAIGIAKFTIPENRVCLLEIFENSGGRNLTLDIANRQLFLARPFGETKTKKK